MAGVRRSPRPNATTANRTATRENFTLLIPLIMYSTPCAFTIGALFRFSMRFKCRSRDASIFLLVDIFPEYVFSKVFARSGLSSSISSFLYQRLDFGISHSLPTCMSSTARAPSSSRKAMLEKSIRPVAWESQSPSIFPWIGFRVCGLFSTRQSTAHSFYGIWRGLDPPQWFFALELFSPGFSKRRLPHPAIPALNTGIPRSFAAASHAFSVPFQATFRAVIPSS